MLTLLGALLLKVIVQDYLRRFHRWRDGRKPVLISHFDTLADDANKPKFNLIAKFFDFVNRHFWALAPLALSRTLAKVAWIDLVATLASLWIDKRISHYFTAKRIDGAPTFIGTSSPISSRIASMSGVARPAISDQVTLMPSMVIPL